MKTEDLIVGVTFVLAGAALIVFGAILGLAY